MYTPILKICAAEQRNVLSYFCVFDDFGHGTYVAVPPLWSKLPPALRQISDPSYELTQTSPLAISPQLFHSKLKPLLLSNSYPDLSSSSIVPPFPSQLQTPSTIAV